MGDDLENDANISTLNHKTASETDPGSNDSNAFLNSSIPIDEVERIINNAKKNKACGFDRFYNDFIHSRDCTIFLYKLFNVCFASGKESLTLIKGHYIAHTKGHFTGSIYSSLV